MPEITAIQMGDNVFADFYYLDDNDKSKGAILENIHGYGRMYDKKSDWTEVSTGEHFGFMPGYIINDISIPDGITSISESFLEYAADARFEKLNFPSNIYIGAGVEEIGRAAFRYYDRDGLSQRGGFKNIFFSNPANLKKVGDLAFSAQHLQYINFDGHTPEELGNQLFYNCNDLVEIDLGKNLNMTYGMFNDCYSLHHFNEDNSIASFDTGDGVPKRFGAMKNCNSIEELTFTEDCVFEHLGGYKPVNNTAYFSVENGKGSNCDEHGYQKTVIHGRSTWAMCHSWLSLEGRNCVLDNGQRCSRPFLVLNHLGKVVKVPLYPNPSNDKLSPDYNIQNFMPINHCGKIWYAVCDRSVYISPLIIRNNLKGEGASMVINYE